MERIIGHRGAAGYAPENTLAAFEKARVLGCHFIEFDVMLSADGEAFIFHDENIKRTTNGRGEFGLLTAEYLRSLDAGHWYAKKFRGEKILSFQDAIAEKKVPDPKTATPEEMAEYRKSLKNEFQSATGIEGEKVETAIQHISRSQLSPFIRFLADLFAPFGAMFPGKA